jgi:hypothetical protein
MKSQGQFKNQHEIDLNGLQGKISIQATTLATPSSNDL